jgi:hypothetical protein
VHYSAVFGEEKYGKVLQRRDAEAQRKDLRKIGEEKAIEEQDPQPT